jgi:predicted house-cleaning noncanonical NTP pyrophosphatase (MazG superfamily)
MSFCEKLNKNLVNETLEDFLKDQEGTQNYNALLEIVESIIKDKNFEKTSI